MTVNWSCAQGVGVGAVAGIIGVGGSRLSSVEVTPGPLRFGNGRGRFVVEAAAEVGGRRSQVAEANDVWGLFGSGSKGVRRRVVQRLESCGWHAEAACRKGAQWNGSKGCGP